MIESDESLARDKQGKDILKSTRHQTLLLLNCYGFLTCYAIQRCHFAINFSCTVIMLALHTWRPILCSMPALSTQKLTTTSFVTSSSRANCSFDLFVATIKQRTFSLKDYLNQSSIIFVANCCLLPALSFYKLQKKEQSTICFFFQIDTLQGLAGKERKSSQVPKVTHSENKSKREEAKEPSQSLQSSQGIPLSFSLMAQEIASAISFPNQPRVRKLPFRLIEEANQRTFKGLSYLSISTSYNRIPQICIAAGRSSASSLFLLETQERHSIYPQLCDQIPDLIGQNPSYRARTLRNFQLRKGIRLTGIQEGECGYTYSSSFLRFATAHKELSVASL